MMHRSLIILSKCLANIDEIREIDFDYEWLVTKF